MGNYTKQFVSSGRFAKHAVAFLNELIVSDPSAIEGLVPPEGPEVEAGGSGNVRTTAENPTRLSVVGVLNSILNRAGSSEYVGHVQDLEGRIVGFQLVAACDVDSSVEAS